jgi:hypothetical protein
MQGRAGRASSVSIARVATAIIRPGFRTMLRRLLLLAALVALVANRRRVIAWVVKATGTNVHTERNASRTT